MPDELPTIEDFMAVKQTAGDPCECAPGVKTVIHELSRETFRLYACPPCKARHAMGEVADVAKTAFERRGEAAEEA